MNEGRIRFWQGFGLSAAAALFAVTLGGFGALGAQGTQKQRFTEIDVERINVIEADGTVKLVIANRERAPDQVMEGESRPRTAANKSPGLTFFDDAGDEAGGLKIRGDRRAGGSARRHLVFDQHRGDQVLGLITDENENGRTAGMTVWDRPGLPLPEVVRRFEAFQALPAGPERARLEREFEECCAGFGATRVFVGKTRSRDAVLSLADARGRERLRLIVSAEGAARIEMVDEQGRATPMLPGSR
jgi:hypothetical protein